MAHKKAAGTARNLKDSPGQRLGIKVFEGQPVKNGNIICRQRGTRWMAGEGVKVGKDHTIYAVKDGVVSFTEKKRVRFDGRTYLYTYIHVTNESKNASPTKEKPAKKEPKIDIEIETIKEVPEKEAPKAVKKPTSEKKAPAKKPVTAKKPTAKKK